MAVTCPDFDDIRKEVEVKQKQQTPPPSFIEEKVQELCNQVAQAAKEGLEQYQVEVAVNVDPSFFGSAERSEAIRILTQVGNFNIHIDNPMDGTSIKWNISLR
jgi:hypothetical protein